MNQPDGGYRVAIDAVLLAAATAALAGEFVLDLGTGVGASALCLAVRVAGVRVVGLEIQPELARLAAGNIAANGLAELVSVVVGDLRHPPLMPQSFHRVMINPPYLRAGAHTPSADPSRAIANGEGQTGLAAWLAAAARLLRPRGTVTVIHRADRMDEVLALMTARFGAIALFPLWPQAGAAAKRILVSGRLASGRTGAVSPARLASGLVLHDADGRFTAKAEAILRDGFGLEL
ncbi:MAG: methyltransferase domain-containing protein [Rhodospirillaceae bacterium]